MRQIDVRENEAGQRLDKFLHKYLPLAPTSFFYKMLRKKNITLNGGRAEGKEKLKPGDCICLYLSEETILGFQASAQIAADRLLEYQKAYEKLKGIRIIYEDSDFLIMDKPAGVLSQKAKEGEISLNEWMIGHLLVQGSLKEEQLTTFRPGICNRLDRNTSGLVIGAKSLHGSQEMNALIQQHELKKYYRLFVAGRVEKGGTLEGYLHKDSRENKVMLVQGKMADASYIRTEYIPLENYKDKTLLEVLLVTGKPHQIRLHMASIGHPILGDAKYGNERLNEQYRKQYGVKYQLLYACRLQMPRMESFPSISEKIFTAPEPELFRRLREN